MSHIKECFTSRWDGGLLLEADWNQLEVVMLQIESQDQTLADELNEGVDLHCALTADVYHLPYSVVADKYRDGDEDITKKRKKMKSARFAMQYGASAPKLAATAEMSVEEAKNFISLYYSKYPGIHTWNHMVRSLVLESAKPTGEIDAEGIPVYKGQYTGPNGRRYVFTGGPKYGKVSFSPTKLQNYPIQGLASDFVKMMRTKVLRELYRYTYTLEAYPINTIHDSIMFDCKGNEELTEIKRHIDQVYKTSQSSLYEMCNRSRTVKVPIKYSIKSGPYWS